MLNINLECSKAYAQHFKFLSFHVLQSFMLNTNINNHVLQSFLLNTNIKYSCALELLAQHKTNSSIMCFRVHSQHKKIYIYIYHMQLAYAQYIKQIIMFMCSGVLDPIYQLKHQSNIITNGAYAHKC